jgi:FkbM family methyltransferase
MFLFPAGEQIMDAAVAELTHETLSVRGRSFRFYDHPVVSAGAREFADGFEEGTLRFFDAVLPRCDHMIDCGAYIGFTALYAAGHGVDVTAFEPSRVNFQFLSANVEVNPSLGRRIAVYNHGIGTRDEHVTLYAKAYADSGASVFQVVERGRAIAGRPDATVELRAAPALLRRAGLNARTLLKIDIEGAEYAVLPAIADLLAERKPWLHVSFHPFNLAAGRDPYEAAVTRLRAALQIAEATACYRYLHLFADDSWCTVGPADRTAFLRQYLLQPKSVPRIASPQYGFVDAVAFSDDALPQGA